MSKTSPAPRTAPAAAKSSGIKPSGKERPKETWRDSVESIVVAFILALLLRGFEAEAFVIPTGSMAPTLMGRHKDVTCPQCGTTYSVNANDEVRSPGVRIVAGTCPDCRYRAPLLDEPSFNGDRILVMKIPYALPWLPLSGGPALWDVVVFHYPEHPQQNYIKRLVGMPNRELMILGGDLWSRPLGTDEPFEIQRKGHRKLRSMLVPVHDDRHRPAALASFPDWNRWTSPNGWKAIEGEPATYAVEAKGEGPAWLEYRHLIPDLWQWDAAVTGTSPQPPQPSLIDDFYSYNTDQTNPNAVPVTEPHWVGDLFTEFDVEVQSAAGQLSVALIKAGLAHRAVIDVATGEATLSRVPADQIDQPATTGEKAPSSLRGPGSHRVAFANIDNRMTLWVDGSPVFGDGLAYDRDPAEPLTPTEADLVPVRVGISGGAARVSNLVIDRDIYYVREPGESDYEGFGGLDQERYLEITRMLRDPSRFAELARVDEPKTYPVRPGHYMMMGDNSPRSHDGRKWGSLDTRGGTYFDDRGRAWYTGPWDGGDRRPFEVPEHLLIGKAFFIYWPHGQPFWPNLSITRDFRFPFRPNVERMELIR